MKRSPPAGGPEIVIRINPLAGEWGTEDLRLAGALRARRHPAAQGRHAARHPGSRRRARRRPMRRGRDGALGDDRDAEGDAQPRRHRRARPRPGLAACLFRCRHQRPRQGHRHPHDARPALSRAAADADRASRRAPAGWRRSTASSTISAMPSAFARECEEAAAMGFDGKTLIHPGQIEPANQPSRPRGGAGRSARDRRRLRAAGECRQGRDRAQMAAWSSGCILPQAEKLLARAKSRPA